MKQASIGGLAVWMAGGNDGKAGGNGPLVILLHGFGAPGDDLVPLGHELDVPAGTRFVFPEGPLSLDLGLGRSRAWWMLDIVRLQADREAGRVRDLTNEIPKGLGLARERMLEFLMDLEPQIEVDPARTVLGGFSQGAMLSCDIVLRTDQPYAGLVQLSGTLLAQAEWRPLMTKRNGLPVFQSHGTQDDILPFVGGEALRKTLTEAGLAVEWHSFDGGHEIPDVVLRQLGPFLTKVLVKL